MSADTPLTSAGALRLLISMSGGGRLIQLGFLMILASLTEGIGLLLLVPITALVAGQADGPESIAWLEPFTQFPAGMLLALAVGVVGLRALIVFAVMSRRRVLGIILTQRLREDCHEAVSAAEWRWLSGENSADHAALIMGEAARVGNLAEQVLSMATALVTVTVLGAAAAMLSWKLTVLALAIGVVTGLLVARVTVRRRRIGEEYSEAYGALHRHVANGLAHLRAARIGGGQQRLSEDFRAITNRLSEVERRYYLAIDTVKLLFQISAAAALALLVWISLFQLAAPLTTVIPVLAILVRAVPLVSGLYQSLRQWHFDLPALQSIVQTMETARRHAEPSAAASGSRPLTSQLALRAVSIGFAGRAAPILENFDLVIPAGSVVGVTGPSGSGKSTLADIASGLMAPDEGKLLIDGRVLTPEERLEWRNRVAYVEQQPFLIEGTIADNVRWGRDSESDDAIRRALDHASAAFVRDLPQGIGTVVGEAGRQLSGGERQRLALARALLGQPDLLILDEVTSALDRANEAVVKQTVNELRGSCTIMILTHSPGLLELADMIVDLADLPAPVAARDA